MPNTFKVKTFTGSSTNANTDMTVYTCPSSTQTTVIGLSVANIVTSQITVDVKLDKGTGDDVFLIKDAPVPVGSSLVVVGGDQKLVLEATDAVKIQSNTANSADTAMSILEIT